jgi:sigma-B regulation protein RsbU (phosphoserine phosphatase)
MALGIEADWKYETSALTVSPGETLFLYTDGISEADGPDGRQFTKRGIEAVLRQAAAKAAAPDALIGAMTSVVKEFAGTIPQSDDITALALRRV